jgi:hypothetical protein
MVVMFTSLDRRGAIRSSGGKMARQFAFGGAARPQTIRTAASRPVVGRGVSSIACLAFVVLLGLAFWAGAAWLGQVLLQMGATLP